MTGLVVSNGIVVSSVAKSGVVSVTGPAGTTNGSSPSPDDSISTCRLSLSALSDSSSTANRKSYKKKVLYALFMLHKGTQFQIRVMAVQESYLYIICISINC